MEVLEYTSIIRIEESEEFKDTIFIGATLLNIPINESYKYDAVDGSKYILEDAEGLITNVRIASSIKDKKFYISLYIVTNKFNSKLALRKLEGLFKLPAGEEKDEALYMYTNDIEVLYAHQLVGHSKLESTTLNNLNASMHDLICINEI